MMNVNHLLLLSRQVASRTPAPKLLVCSTQGESQEQGIKQHNPEILDRDIRKLGRVFRDCQSEILGLSDKNLNIEVNIQ